MESHHEHFSEHRWEILQKLYERNKNERKRYEDVVHLSKFCCHKTSFGSSEAVGCETLLTASKISLFVA